LDARREDIPLLAEHFLTRLTKNTGTPRVYAPEAMQALVAASWPGNVRQLLNMVERNVALSAAPVISEQEVSSALGNLAGANMPSYDDARDEFTRSYLIQLLRITGGSVTRAARLAKRNRTDMYKLMQRCGIDREQVGN
jgi:two-component system response regulator GlrR